MNGRSSGFLPQRRRRRRPITGNRGDSRYSTTVRAKTNSPPPWANSYARIDRPTGTIPSHRRRRCPILCPHRRSASRHRRLPRRRDMDRYPDDRRNTAEYLMAVQSTAMAAQNLLLAAHCEGLGACVMCAPLFCPGSVAEGLSLPSEWKPQMLVTIGVPANAGKIRPRLPLARGCPLVATQRQSKLSPLDRLCARADCRPIRGRFPRGPAIPIPAGRRDRTFPVRPKRSARPSGRSFPRRECR